MNIREVNPYKPSDLEMLIELHKSCLPSDYYPNFMSAIWWIAFENKKPVAFCGLSAVSSWKNAGYLCRAGVIDAYKGRGIQRKLIRIREKKARKLGYEWLISDTTNNNPSANNLISCGYKLYQPETKWAYPNSLYWRKKL